MQRRPRRICFRLSEPQYQKLIRIGGGRDLSWTLRRLIDSVVMPEPPKTDRVIVADLCDKKETK